MEEYRSSLEKHFLKHPPATVKRARDEIEKLTGINRSETQVRRFLHTLGCRPRKIGMIPAKVDAERQEEFLEKKLNPILDEAKNGKNRKSNGTRASTTRAEHPVISTGTNRRKRLKRARAKYKAISVKESTISLVFSPVFGVATTVT